jgi:polysaccharide deacetylase family protein (PEP-CTERM system associated)
MLNIISVDVEDYFHPSEIQRGVDASTWSSLPSRVDSATGRILDLFARYQVQATFFILGWVAERSPALVRRIASEGHEVACHSYAHRLVYELTPDQFRQDTVRAVKVIEDACGRTARAYRAPSYSIVRDSFWALDVLAELGFTHDSSIYPIAHDRYGVPGFGRHVQTIQTSSGPLVEVPIATVQLSGTRVAPVGGGGYLRLLPYRYTAAGIRRLNRTEEQPACMYFHPWEVDPDQPRLAKGLLSGLRTYAGLRGMHGKIERLLRDFQFSTLTSVHPAAAVRQT